MVDLEFELLRESVVGDSDECTANLDNLTLAKGRSEVEQVFEAVCGIGPHLDVTVHDGRLSNLDETLNTSRLSKKSQVGNFLAVAMLERLTQKWGALADELNADLFDRLSDAWHEGELSLLRDLLEDRIHR